MARFMQSSIDEVLRRTDLAEFASGYVSLRRNGSDFVGLCPFHREKTPSFHINGDKQLFYCFGCGSGGNLIDFVKRIENLDFVDAIRFLAERAGVTLEEEVYSPEIKKQHDTRERILKMNKLAAKRFVANLAKETAKTAQEYAARRGLSREIITQFGIGFAEDSWSDLTDYLNQNGYKNDEIVAGGLAVKNGKGHVYDKFRNRLMFPIIDVRGNVIAFSGRALDDSPAKYMNSPETPVFHKGDHLFALNLAKQYSAKDGLILVEGNMDAVSLHAHGFPNAVAGLGTALTNNQASLLKRYAPVVYICYDSDDAGQKAAQKAIEVLSAADIKLKILSYSGAKDPDDFLKTKGKESFKQLLLNALSATEYKILKLRKSFNLVNAQDKIEFLNQTAEILAENKNPVEREIYIKRISQETDISVDSIAAQVNKLIYDKNRKEYKKAKQKVQSIPKPDRSNTPGMVTPANAAASTASYKTERMLLNLMFFSNPAFRIAKKEISPEEFDSSLHRALFEAIIRFKEVGESCDAPMFFSTLADDIKSSAADILYKEYLGDAVQAIKDNIEKMKKENLNSYINKLAAEGRIDEINALIKKENERRSKID